MSRRRTNATGRNTGERFVILPHYLLRCDAWKTLTPNAKALLLDVWARHNGANNGAIPYAVREAEGIGLVKSVAARAFSELQGRGFLKLHKNATFALRTKEARTWQITAERCRDEPATKDFMRWKNGGEKNRTRSPQRDAWSLQRDTSTPNETKLPGLVPPERPKQSVMPSDWSHQRDTYNIPCAPQTPEPTQHVPQQPMLQQAEDGTAARAGRQLTQAKEPGNPGSDPAEPVQIDLEDFLTALPSCSPADQLRLALKAKLLDAPRGEQARLAKLVNLSRFEISHFLSGKRTLNRGAMAVLRQYLDGP